MTDPHAAAEVVRTLYQSLAKGDLPAVKACFTPDALWHLPGHSPIAGDHIGPDAIMGDFMAKLGPLSGGTFTAELLDVAVGEQYVVAIQHATAAHNGKTLDITGCQLMAIRGG